MPQELDFSLPPRGAPKPPAGRSVRIGLFVLLALTTVNLLLAGWMALRSTGAGRGMSASVPDAEALRAMALAFERQDLVSAAVQAWKDHLAAARLPAEDAARIWYRIGTLQQKAGQYESALEAYGRSEHCAAVADLKTDITRHSQECLEALGKFAALRETTRERVGFDAKTREAGSRVVAEIGAEKITRADLDRRIEDEVTRGLAQQLAGASEEELRRRKEALMQRISGAEEKGQFLSQILAADLLYRKAREMRLADSPNVRERLEDAEKAVLARALFEREMAEKIRIGPTDLQNYYEAHRSQYVRPERVRISHILAADEAGAQDALKKIKDGQSFETVAKEVSLDKSTGAGGGAIETWIPKGASRLPAIGDASNIVAAVFATEAGRVCEKPFKTDKGYEVIKIREREEERTPPFEEVQEQVARALRMEKEREVQEQLIERLKTEYRVVLHPSELGSAAEGELKKKE